MTTKSASNPAFIAAALWCFFVVLSCGTCSSGHHAEEGERFKQLESKMDQVLAALKVLDEAPSNDLNIEFHTKSEAEQSIAELGTDPPAEKLAEKLAMIDTWIASPEEADQLQAFKAAQIDALRRKVKEEVEALHDEALGSQSGKEAAKLYAKASQILALFPMDTTDDVLEEARELSSKHADVGPRLEVMRRLRYNAWAVECIENTIENINKVASSFRTSDNPKVIKVTVEGLREIDPLLLEPAVLQVYNYAVELAKSNVNKEQQVELAKGMVDPQVQRKGYGDF